MSKRKELSNGFLYTRVQGFILLVLGVVGLRYFLPFIGINVTLETVRVAFIIGFIGAGILGSVSLFFNGLTRLLSGRVDE